MVIGNIILCANEGEGSLYIDSLCVICGNITGNFSNPISVNTCILYPIETNTAYITSISSLAAALIISTAAILTVIAIILTRNRTKIKAALDLQGTNTEGQSTVYTAKLHCLVHQYK